jgi:2-isopropylmalate synthase
MKNIKVFDTTLRDGEQCIGFLLDHRDKWRALGAVLSIEPDYIELGYPASSEVEHAFIARAALEVRRRSRSIPVTFARLTPHDIDVAATSLQESGGVVQLLGVGSELHLTRKRRISEAVAHTELADAVRRVKRHAGVQAAVIFEDASRADPAFLKRQIAVALDAGAEMITYADTVGYCTPMDAECAMTELIAHFGHGVIWGVHFHNDLGMATANTLFGVRGGADLIQVTLGGIGERAGNCALEEVYASLLYKSKTFGAVLSLDPKKLLRACEDIFRYANKSIPTNKPIIGEHVFSTSAGIHQDGLMKDPQCYEYVEAAQFGRSRVFVSNRLSSKRLELAEG